MRFCLPCLLVFALAACASKPPAPVIERSGTGYVRTVAEDGRYKVRRGDTLHAIAFSFRLDHRDLARWNGIRPPYTIYPGQALRLAPRPAAKTVNQRTSQTRPKAAASKPAPARSGASAVKPAQTPKPAASEAPASTDTPAGGWAWPVNGRVLRSFSASDPARNGLDIAGTEGDSVRASAAGSVVYSGNGLIGYGELIIIKHSDRVLSAYAHNRRRLVAEGDSIRAGQKIAEMGRNDRNEALLHFEIRLNGRPVNPMDYLPAR